MIAKKSGLLALVLSLQVGSVFAAPSRGVRPTGSTVGESATLTHNEARKILTAVEGIVKEMREYNAKNRAPRPSAPQECDDAFPAPCFPKIDLSELLNCLCEIKRDLDCVLEKSCSIVDMIGNLCDESCLLPSVVDKADIDNLKKTVISLLKTILLELRGQFQ